MLNLSDILTRIDHIFSETHVSDIPVHKPRVNALYEKTQSIEWSRINLFWL